MDGFISLGEYFATLDERHDSGMPAFLEQGETPESELADPTSFIVPREKGFTSGKTTLEEEQIQDLWLAVGRDYKIRPQEPTFQKRIRGRAITHSELAAMLRKEAPTVFEENLDVVPREIGARVSTESRARPVRRMRTTREIVRRSDLGQLPIETMPVVSPTGVGLTPSARIIEKIAPPERQAPTPKKKTDIGKLALIVGGLALVGVGLAHVVSSPSG